MSNNESNDINEKEKQRSLTSPMACTKLNNPNSSEGPPGPRYSTNEYRRNSKKKFPSLAKEEGRLVLRNVAIRLRRHKRGGPPSLPSLQKKKLKLRCFSPVRTGEEPRAKKCSVSAIHNSWRGHSRIDNRS
jgi:hypothetical protein